MNNQLLIQNIYSKNIVCKASISSKDTLIYILVPGFMGTMDSPPMEILFSYLHQFVPIFTFNFSGSGVSDFPPIHECIEDLITILSYLSKNHSCSFILIGHSLGGIICTSIAANNEWKSNIKQLFLLAVPASTNDFEKRHPVLINNGVITTKIRNETVALTNIFLSEMKTFNVTNILEQLDTNTIIIHGEKDKLVPIKEAEKNFSLLQSKKTLFKIQEAGHMFSNDIKQVEIADIILSFQQ